MPAKGLSTVVAGAGLMGRWHAYEIDRAGARVAAVVDPDPLRAERLADRHDGARAYASLGDALDGVTADVVHLCSPSDTHVELAGQALDSGLHVLAEKPLAPDAVSTRSLVERARARDRLLCPVHQFPFQRGARRLFGALDRLGPVRHVDFAAFSAGAEGGRDAGRVAREILPHPLSLLQRLTPPGLAALRWSAVEASPGEVRVSGAGAGLTTSLVISMSGRPTDNRLRVVGEGGTARLDLFHGYAVISPAGRPSRVRKAAGPFLLAGHELAAAGWNLTLRTFRAQPAYPGLRELVRAFHRAAAGGEASPISPDEILSVAEAGDRVRERLADDRTGLS